MEEPRDTEKIPKTLHYVWVGPRAPSALVERCMASWREQAPGFAVRFWNEENGPMDHLYVREMYRQKKWAFVSDYIRFWALEREGGVYLDTDMELLKPIDRFLDDGAFLGRSKDGYTACGIVGASPGHPLLRAILDSYDSDTDFSIENTSPRVVTRILASGGFPDVRIYEPSYFYPCDDGERCGLAELRDAYATHHWAESWVPYAGIRKLLRRTGVMRILKKAIGS